MRPIPGTSTSFPPEGNGREGQMTLCIVDKLKAIGLEDIQVLPGKYRSMGSECQMR